MEPATGLLHYIGRADFQVKINGQRIELGEIEACITSAPLQDGVRVEQVVVMKRALEGMGTGMVDRLLGYVTLSGTWPGEGGQGGVEVQVRHDPVALSAVERIRQHCRTHLPAYMVPSHLLPVNTFPLSLNGKVQRSALPQPEAAEVAGTRGGRTACTETCTETELRVVDVWREVLGLAADWPVLVEAEFVAVGGNSLQQIRLAASLSRAFARPVPVAELLRRQTIAEQAAWMDAQLHTGAGHTTAQPPDWAPAGLTCSVASAAQQRFYLEEQRTRTAEVSMYAVLMGPFLVACLGSVDETLRRVEAVCLELVERHPVLRTALFVDEQSGTLQQRVLSMDEWRQVSGERGDVVTPCRVTEALPAVLRAELCRPLDLDAGSVLRVRCSPVRRGADGGWTLRLWLCSSHCAVDGWSSGVVERDVRTLLDGVQCTPPTSVLRWQPTDWAQYEAKHVLVGEEADTARVWWRERARQVQPGYRASLPQLGGPGLTGRSSRAQVVQLPPRVVRHVDELRQSPAVRSACAGVQPTRFIAYLALTQLWLGQLTGQLSGAALVVHDSGRSRHPMLADMVCCTVNTVVLPYTVSTADTFVELIGQVHRQWGDTLQHVHTPITHVVADTPALDLTGMPSFNFLELEHLARKNERSDDESDEWWDETAEDEKAGDETAEDEQVKRSAVSTLDIEFRLTTPLASASGRESELPQVELSLSAQDASAHVSVESLVRVVEQVIGQPEAGVSSHSLLPSATVERLVERREQAEQAASRAAQLPSIVQSFLRSARSQPSRPAVLFGPRVVSYGELLHAGLRVAARLRLCMASRPIRSSSGEVPMPNIVCVSIERSVELIVAMIAIQLAGLVYCPVHVSLPTARKAELYTQTECSVVLTLSKHSDDVTAALSTVQLHHSVTSVCVDALLSSAEQQLPLADELSDLPADLHQLERPAYAIFTSGTTGKPKAAVISHQALATFTSAMQELCMVQPGSVVLQVSEVTFDVSILDVYTSLGCECTISLLAPIGLMDPAHVLDTIAEHRVTFAFFVPSVLRLLVQQCEAEQRWPQLASFRGCSIGGEAFDVQLARRVDACFRTSSTGTAMGRQRPPCSPPSTAEDAELQSDSQVQTVPIGRALPRLLSWWWSIL